MGSLRVTAYPSWHGFSGHHLWFVSYLSATLMVFINSSCPAFCNQTMPDCSGQIHILILELRVKSALGLTHAPAQREGCVLFSFLPLWLKNIPTKINSGANRPISVSSSGLESLQRSHSSETCDSLTRHASKSREKSMPSTWRSASFCLC